jgi:type I restriction enzyme S subunit
MSNGKEISTHKFGKSFSLPKDWKFVSISEFGRVITGSTPSMNDLTNYGDEVPWCTTVDMKDKYVARTRIYLSAKGANIARIVPKGAILVTCIGTIGKIAIAAVDLATNQQINSIVVDNNVNNEYLYYAISNYVPKMQIIAGKTSVPIINKSTFENFCLPCPPISMQLKIAQILSTWDRAIERVQRLIEAKQRLKKGLMQGLLTGRLRFPEFGESINSTDAFPPDWEVKKLKQVFSQIDRPLGNHVPESVLSISAKIGFVDQKTKFGKVVAGKSLEKYILLQRGEFAYNRGNSNAYPQGCIYMLTEYDEGAIPNVYYAFRVKSGNIFPQFYQYYFESGLLNPQLKMFISSSARGDGLFNISSKDFFRIRIIVPPFEEQKKIAGVLGGMDEQIALLKKYLERLKEQKKGLMQKLLTGEIRVKVD